MFPKLYKFIATLLIPVMALGSLPLVSHAGIVSTEEALVTPAGDADRIKVSSFLARDEVRQALASQGVDTTQAIERVQAMSDAEVAQLADRVDNAPAGAGIVGTIFLVFLILLITDILGLTSVFPFTRPIR